MIDVPGGRPSLFGSGSAARGVAVLAWLALVLVGIRALRDGLGTVDRLAVESACQSPLEILDSSGVRLACVGESQLQGCDPAPRLGDRVRQEDGACQVVRGGMGAPSRLLVGLPIDVNRAGRADLELIRGIGPSLAAAIVSEREQGGEFSSIDDLVRVRGIGAKSVERFRPLLSVELRDNGSDD